MIRLKWQNTLFFVFLILTNLYILKINPKFIYKHQSESVVSKLKKKYNQVSYKTTKTVMQTVKCDVIVLRFWDPPTCRMFAAGVHVTLPQ